MSLLVAIVILMMLMWTEFCSPQTPKDPLYPSAAVLAVTFLVPAVAAFQIWIARRRHNECLPSTWFSRLKGIATVHSIIWVASAVFATSALQWPWIVCGATMGCSLPLLDELLTILPVMFSLIASWAVFVFGSPADGLSVIRSRREVFSLWIRMRVLVVAAPILFAFFLIDIANMAVEFRPDVLESLFVAALICLFTIGILAIYPRVILAIWNTRGLSADDAGEREIQHRIDRLFDQAACRRCEVRVWITGENVANAAAVGVIPGSQVLVISDLMLKLFPEEQLDAIVLHEIGHVKKHHAAKRMLLIVVPLLLLMLDQQLTFGLHAMMASSEFLSTRIGVFRNYLFAAAFLAYIFAIFKVWFRKMEFEADQFAAGSCSTDQVIAALERFAVIHPRQSDRSMGYHPSLRQRVLAIANGDLTLPKSIDTDHTGLSVS